MREQVKRDGVEHTPSLLWCQENRGSSALLFLLPVQVQEEADIQQHTHRCGVGADRPIIVRLALGWMLIM